MSRASDPGEWAALCAAFDRLVELDAGARAEELAALGAADPEVRRALEELLEADADSAARLCRIDEMFGAGDTRSQSESSAERDVLKLVGQTVAHFRIVKPLAAGGMGVVYRAVDTRLGRPVALKFPLPGQRLDSQGRERFLREARAAGALDHPNICSIYETGETEDGQLFLAMPLYRGETLKARIARTGPLPIAEALAIAAQIARGLSAAHRAGIVHRDLKPANAMVLSDGTVRILDFGVARVGDTTLTASHGALGTVSYMAPEQVRGERLDGRADLWALGVLLYEMVTGRRPFEGENGVAIAHAIVHSDPVRPSVLRPEISAELAALVMGLLARDPAGRPAPAEAVVAELTALESPLAASKVRRRHARFSRSMRRTLAWTATALVVAAGVMATWRLRPGAGNAVAQPRIVAVIPFDDSTGREDSGYLPIALGDEIATRLSHFSAVGVTSEGTTQEYRGSGKPVGEIATELGADAVVRGSVRRTGNDVRLRLDLFDGRKRRQVWSGEYRDPVDSLLALPRRATDRIVAELGLEVKRSERAELMRVPTASGKAYELFLHGRAAQLGADAFGQTQLASLQRAQSYFARARESDPDFAAARVGLAISHLALSRYDESSARLDQARIEAETALRLQPGMPEAHEALASYWLRQNDPSKGTSELQQALVGRPNAPDLYRLLGSNLRDLGRWEEALDLFEQASRLDPRNRPVHYQASLTYARLRRYDESIAHWDRVIAMDSAGDPFPRIIRGFNYLRRGDLDSLDAAIRRIPLGVDAGGMTTYAHYTAHRMKGRYAEALASLDSARVAISADGGSSGYRTKERERLLYRPVSLLRAQTLERMGSLAGARSAYDAARALLEDSVAAYPRDGSMRIALGLAYAGLHRRADAVREARTATGLVPVSGNSPSATAFMGGAVEIYAELGDVDAALQLIELLLAMPAGREMSVPLLRLDPTFDPLRKDPRFDALLARFSRN